MEQALNPWPTDIRLQDGGKQLQVEFEDTSKAVLSAELLRVESPSAEVQGHQADQKKLIKDKAGVRITDIEPVGRYAVRLIFDDGHDTGIYSWVLLHDYGVRAAALMAAYQARILEES